MRRRLIIPALVLVLLLVPIGYVGLQVWIDQFPPFELGGYSGVRVHQGDRVVTAVALLKRSWLPFRILNVTTDPAFFETTSTCFVPLTRAYSRILTAYPGPQLPEDVEAHCRPLSSFRAEESDFYSFALHGEVKAVPPDETVTVVVTYEVLGHQHTVTYPCKLLIDPQKM